MQRRDFIGKFARTAVAASTVAVCRPAWADQQVVGANERIRVGWIGCGGRGTFVARCFRESPDAEIVAVCDVYQSQADDSGGVPTDWGTHRFDVLHLIMGECVRSRKRPVADVELGHQATNVAHLANIAYKTGRKLRWDGQRERFVDDAEADQLLAREARKPWDFS